MHTRRIHTIYLICAFGFAGLGIMLALLSAAYEWIPIWLTPVILTISFMSLIRVTRAGLHMDRQWSFNRTFGFIPTKSKDLIERTKQRHIEQDDVTKVLHMLAIEFDIVAKVQEGFSGPPKELVADQKEASRLLANEVRKAKKAFWQAHAMARREGFGVFGSFKDYLLIPVLK